MSSSEIIQRVAALVSGNRATSVGSAATSDAEGSDSENNGSKKRRPIIARLRRSESGAGTRGNHLRHLVSERHARQRYLHKLLRREGFSDGSFHGNEDIEAMMGSSQQPTRRGRKPKTPDQLEHDDQGIYESELRDSVISTDGVDYELSETQKDEMEKMSETMKSIKKKLDDYKGLSYNFPVEVRIDNLSYTAPVMASSNKIKTVYNSSIIYKIVKFCKNIGHKEAFDADRVQSTKVILDRISLSLKPGRMYLLLGPPSSGKSSLLKAIAGRLSVKNGEETTGSVTYNGRSFKDKNHFHIENAIAFVDQLDCHAPRMTVDETFEFAFQCKNGGTHAQLLGLDGDKEKLEHAKKMAKRADQERLLVSTNLKSLGLEHVKDTFVGNDDVRGVSGGQRRRVTVGEMMLGATPVFLGDEISNGLDASSTFEMIQILTHLSKDYQRVRVISLLQPSPETVALFDEIILLADGKVLFAGPISVVEDYFAKLGYRAPPYMDVADFLQMLSVPADCEALFQPPPEIASSQTKPYTTDQLAEIFRASIYGERISASIGAPHKFVWGSSIGGISVAEGADHLDDRRYYRKYMNSFPRSIMLNMKRNLILWIRDRRVLIANAAKNIIMGISVGGVFFHTDDVVSILGAFFQGMLFIMLGAMTIAPGFVDERVIYYKQADANFFASFPFVIGKSLAKLPQTTVDCFTFGTILYFMVGLAPTVKNYFIFIAILVAFNVLMNELLFVFATFARTKDMVQIISACVVFFFILFSGFIIPPNVVPDYYEWLYWYSPIAWAYRALVINQYRSPEFTTEEGDEVLVYTGFVDPDGVPFTMEWVGYTFIYLLSHSLITMVLSGFFLKYVRITNISGVKDDEAGIVVNQGNQSTESSGDTNISFKPVTLTFENICYDVQTSKGGETLRLLHEVNGAFRSGRMCALMGSSGAGKTTLMDVIAMRKTSGDVQGDVRLNGFPQDPIAFRRCSGFVEQFDVQTPQLTVRETVLFSARLRIDVLKVEKDEDKQAFVDYVLKTLELTPLADVLVGSSSEGGLTFEQKKRLSIAVELAASPSILFLDEPTTGLDSRSALLVVKLLRKIADQGRTICATIHQPSSAVFDMFDDLLLLKTGGRVVYFGETGEQSKCLIDYFESHGARRIEMGDNPANWMLREMQSPDNPSDLADVYVKTEEYKLLKESLKEVRETQIPELEITFPTKFAAPSDLRQRLVNKRLQTIYWRSPAYNLSRLLVCCVIAFILGSVFLGDRNPKVLTESDMRAQLSVIFLSFIIVGILSITSVLPVMLSIRDVFYRHRSAGMLDNISLGWALGTAEKWFIVLASFLFVLVQVGVTGIPTGSLGRTIRFWGIFTFNLAIYSYFGQAFMCMVRSMATAQILASVFIGLNNFFSGLIVRPQFMTTGFFAFTYWITPGHYVYEGLVMAQYNQDNRTVVAVNGSAFYDYLGCTNATSCYGTVEQFVYVFFGGRFNADNELQDILVLALFLVTARVLTFYALKKFNFSNT